MSNREMIEGAFKRVNALTGTRARLYYDSRYGYSIINVVNRDGVIPMRFDESNRKAAELVAYLHGVEDTLKYMKGN